MEIKSQEIFVDPSPRDAEGKQIDAEEKPAERIMVTDVPVRMNNGQSAADYTGGRAGGFAQDSTINVVGNALEFASGMKHRCALCRNFDNEAFRAWKARKDIGSMDDRREVNILRGQMMERYAELIDQHAGTDGDLDVEHALNTCGLCKEIGAILHEDVIVWPDGGCPDYPGPKGEDLTACFKPRNREAVQTGNAAYDAILKTAAGRPVRHGVAIRPQDWLRGEVSRLHPGTAPLPPDPRPMAEPPLAMEPSPASASPAAGVPALPAKP